MATFSFKSAGRTRTQVIAETTRETAISVGIKTPVRFGTDEGIFAMHTSVADQVHDNLRNLILTNWGERLGFYDFGANLRPLTTELVSQTSDQAAFDEEAISRISSTVAKWMPFVDLEDFSSVTDQIENKNTAVIRLTLTYNVPALAVKTRALQVILYAI